ncbi:MAG: CHAD domain-containing protein [Candidatus Sulfotelmatobacter sp.]
MSIAPKRSRQVFQKLERDLEKLSSKPKPDNVHGVRTGTRRLQILLGELSPKPDRGQKKLLKLLSRIRKRAGKVRDLDVQLAALRSLKIPRQPRRKTQLVNHLIELRGRQEKKLRKAVDKKTVREIRKRLKRAAEDFNPKASRDPLTVARGMLAEINRSDAPVNEALLHHYRILSKRARYAAELADSPEAQRFITGVKRVQDALGDWHDWLTLTQTAGEHLGEVRDSPLVAELHNVTGAKFRHAVAVLSQVRDTPISTHENKAQAPARSPETAIHPATSAA